MNELSDIAAILKDILKLLESATGGRRPLPKPLPGRKRGRPRTILTDIKTYKAMKQREYYAKRKAARKAASEGWQ